MGWVQCCLAESQSRLYPYMRAKFGRDPTAGSKKVPFNFISRCFETIFGPTFSLIYLFGILKNALEEEEETLFDPKSANIQCITYQIQN